MVENGKDGKIGYYRKRTFGNQGAQVVGLFHVRHDNVDYLIIKKTNHAKAKRNTQVIGHHR
jgi:hypothetical protein